MTQDKPEAMSYAEQPIGVLGMRIYVADGFVVIEYHTPVEGMAMPAEQALKFGQKIVEVAQHAINGTTPDDARSMPPAAHRGH